jgi:hypothetical protein
MLAPLTCGDRLFKVCVLPLPSTRAPDRASGCTSVVGIAGLTVGEGGWGGLVVGEGDGGSGLSSSPFLDKPLPFAPVANFLFPAYYSNFNELDGNHGPKMNSSNFS